mmetsp:Transcript_3222/g.2765  ORF Transcript_3222/g.2765 Transcript_3222/m.2765 type:complete len:330 (+) Transcript_3222:120-1109(+)
MQINVSHHHSPSPPTAIFYGEEPTTPPPMSRSVSGADMGMYAEAEMSPLKRQMAKKNWQPNSEGSHCAISSCGMEFGNRHIFSGRHHCRACGRVVCAECSLGSRVMAPPRGEAGVARSVRVCDACLRMGQTFDFPSPLPSPHSISSRTLRRQGSMESFLNLEDGFIVQPAPKRGGLRPVASAPCLQSLSGAHTPVMKGQGPMSVNRDARVRYSTDGAKSSSDDEHSSSDTALSSSNDPTEVIQPPVVCDVVTLPQQIKADKGMGAKRDSHRSIEDLADKDEALAQKFKQLEANYAHSSYYQGLLEYEPGALKALLLSEVSAQAKASSTI